MGPNRTFMAACVALAAWALPAGAQPQGDPADPAARVPAATYGSPFAGYRALGEEAVGDWRAANDEVGRIGGWREYAREAQDTGTSRSQPDDAPIKPAAGKDRHGSHGAHHMPASKP